MSSDVIFEALTCKSVTEMKLIVQKAMKKQKEEASQLQQQQQQIDQLTQQLKEAVASAKQAQKQIEQMSKEKADVDRQKFEAEQKLEWFKAYTDRNYKQTMAGESKKRTQAEILQLSDDNPYNDKIVQF